MPQPQDPFLTSAGWSLNELLARGRRFREIPHVSVSDQSLDVIIRQHEASGVPLVIEGMHKHETWPTAMFDIHWLRDNLKQQIQVRNVPTRQDLDVSFAQFLDHVKSIHHYASADETSRWYAKDLECPREWKEWLDTTTLIPSLLRPHGPADIMQNLPERGRVETLMCYLGIGDTFTPCHKDLCASFGHNLMCYTEDGGSAFWFMTDGSSASSMAKYFQSLGQELDLESHAMSIEEFSAAPCDIYITEQRVGDLVLVPPRSCHQVVNHCGPTVKMSWSRMTIRSAQVALRHELPIYKRVCRAETYRTKSTIHHALRRNTVLLEKVEVKGEDDSASNDISRRQLGSDVQALLELFQEVIQEEYHPDAEILDHIIRDFNHEVYDTGGYSTFSCDFCGADIFVSFFCCKDCTLSEEKPSSVSDGLHICPGCYAEGRSCRCEGLMEPVQSWPIQILYVDYNRAVRALRGIGVDVFNEVGDEVLRNNATGIFAAGTAIQKWRAERSTNKGVLQCHAKRARPHAGNAVTLHCGKCHKSRRLVHFAEIGVHSSEAIVFYRMSRDQGPFHNFHLARRKSIAADKETILAAEVSGDGFAKLIGQKLAIIALSYPHCQPLNVSRIKLGWYDTLRSDGMPVAALGPSCVMDMSFPRDGDDWGSPLTEIGPEDSVSNTLVGQETPPRDPPKSGVSVSAKVQSSAAGMAESMKRKRPSFVFSGVAPPERKRKMNAGHTPSATHPSRPSTSVRSDEKVQLESHQSTRPTASLEGSLAQVISKIETLTTTIVEQNRKIEMLVHDNTDLRDEIRNLSQTLQLSKRDLQRVEYTIPKMIGELKGKFEKMLDKSESRLQGPIDRLLEELGRMRANPSAPVHMPSITTSRLNAPFAPEPVPGDSEYAPRDDFIPADHLNKQHYQENFEQHVPAGPPHHKYGRSGFRHFRGRGRGFRGHYSGNRPSVHRPYFPPLPEGYGIVRVTATTTLPTPTATTPVLTTPVPVPVSVAAGSPAPRHVDPYHSHAYPPHPIPIPSSTPASTSAYSRDPRPHVPSHSHADRRALPPPSPSPAPSSSYQRRWHASHPQTYERAQTSLPPPLPLPPPRSQYRDDERHRVPPAPRSEADPHDHDGDDGYRDVRYGNTSYTAYSPSPSDEQLRWMTTPSDSVGQLHSQSRSQSPGPGSGPSRGYAGHAPVDDVGGGRK